MFTGITYSANKAKQEEQRAQSVKGTYYEARGAEQSPLFIQIVPGTQSKEDADYKEYERHKKPFYESIGAISTVWIAIITTILALLNIGLWRATKKSADAAKQAADAAQRSANALPAIERAYVFVTINGEVKGIEWGTPGDTIITLTIPIYFRNEGKTPAILTNIVFDILQRQEAPTKSIFPLRKIDIPPGGRVISGGGNYRLRHEEPLSVSQWEEIQANGLLQLFCYGKVTYRDILKNEQWTSFCWEYNPPRKRFIVCENTDLNDYT